MMRRTVRLRPASQVSCSGLCICALCYLKSFSSGSPSLVTKQQVTTTFIVACKAQPTSARHREGWVLLFVCPWKFHGDAQDWKKLAANLGQAARDWATHALSSHKDPADTFKFEALDADKNHAQLRGLMRVLKSGVASSLLKASGQADAVGTIHCRPFTKEFLGMIGSLRKLGRNICKELLAFLAMEWYWDDLSWGLESQKMTNACLTKPPHGVPVDVPSTGPVKWFATFSLPLAFGKLTCIRNATVEQRWTG